MPLNNSSLHSLTAKGPSASGCRAALALAGLMAAMACTRTEPNVAAPPATAAAEAAQAKVDSKGLVAATELPADVSAAMDRLQNRLKERLMAEVAKGGPAAAVEVCRTEAAAITAELNQGGLKIGRTSHGLRNPANAAPQWSAAWVQAQGGRKVAAGPKLAAVNLPGGAKGYVRAIGTASVCVTCHGPAEQLAPPIRELLAQRYPQDRATGFVENDLRGWFWAEKAP